MASSAAGTCWCQSRFQQTVFMWQTDQRLLDCTDQLVSEDIGWARVARSWVRFIPAFTLTLRWVLEQEMTSPLRLQVHGQEHINPPDVSRFPLDGHLELWRLELEAKTLQDDDGHTWSSMWEEDREQVGFVSKWNIRQDQDEEVIVHFVGQHRPIGGVNSYAFQEATADIVIKASSAGIVWGCVAQASWASLQTPSTHVKASSYSRCAGGDISRPPCLDISQGC